MTKFKILFLATVLAVPGYAGAHCVGLYCNGTQMIVPYTPYVPYTGGRYNPGTSENPRWNWVDRSGYGYDSRFDPGVVREQLERSWDRAPRGREITCNVMLMLGKGATVQARRNWCP